MPVDESPRPGPLCVVCLEDNPLLVFHLEQMIEDLGQAFGGSFDSFAALKKASPLAMDIALVDIDLADGRTGPAAASFLREQGVAVGFVTGQVAIAAQYAEISTCVLAKPFTAGELGIALAELRRFAS